MIHIHLTVKDCFSGHLSNPHDFNLLVNQSLFISLYLTIKVSLCLNLSINQTLSTSTCSSVKPSPLQPAHQSNPLHFNLPISQTLSTSTCPSVKPSPLQPAHQSNPLHFNLPISQTLSTSTYSSVKTLSTSTCLSKTRWPPRDLRPKKNIIKRIKHLDFITWPKRIFMMTCLCLS